jgi:hypothetical protein
MAINDDTVTGAEGMVAEGQTILDLIKSDIDESHKTLCCFKPSRWGSVAPSRCTTTHPLYTRFDNISGPLFLNRQCDRTLPPAPSGSTAPP